MNSKEKQFKKILNIVLVPKINDLFSKYGDIKIVNLEILGIDLDRPHLGEGNKDIYLSITYNKYKDGMQFVSSWVGYLVQNMLSYVFIEELNLQISHEFLSSDRKIDTGYYPHNKITNEYAYKWLEDELNKM